MDIIQHISMKYSDYQRNNTTEYIAQETEYSNAIEQLKSSITGEQWKLFLELESQRNLLAAMDEEAQFCLGFRIGAKLMLDILTTNVT